MSRRKVALTLPNLQGGGAERVAVTLLRHLDRSRFEPFLLLGARQGALLDDLPEDIEIIELGATRTRQVVPELIRRTRELAPDVLFGTAGFDLAVGLARPWLPRRTATIGRLANTPSAHRDEVARRSKLAAAAFVSITALVARQLDALVCQSDRMAEDARRTLLAPARRLVRIYNPVDAERVLAAAGPERERPTGGATRWVSVGNLHWRKGYDWLLEAFARHLTVEPEATLDLWGEGAERARLETIVAELGLGERVRLRGFVKNPHAELRSADVFVSSSRYEGFANVIVEAMALGLPVLATDCPGANREVIRDGKNGWLCPEGAEGIREGLMRAQTAWRGLDRRTIASEVQARFSVARIVAEYEALFERLATARA